MKDPKKQFYFFLLLIICGSSIPGKSIPSVINLSWDKLLHILEYAIMGWLAFRAFKEEIKSPKLVLPISGIIFGCIDEAWQSMIPGRFPSHYDIIADGIGVILGVITGSFLNKSS